ncbi:hypothetical protein B0H13DRAFT_2367223 [Mycena leptocephala]|nr:hypothetical protein B0H13DRAFT_2367223 [Mycena leptocephala]
MASISPAAELELLQLIADARTTNYLAAAGITVLLFEHISTFPEEVRFVWKNRLSLWSVLYVWIRYYTLVMVLIDVSFMFREIKSSPTEMITCTIVSVSIECILVLRVWILYGKSRTLLYFLGPLMTVQVIAMLTIGIVSIMPVKEFLHIGQATMLSVSKSALTQTQTDFNGVLPGDGFSIVRLLCSPFVGDCDVDVLNDHVQVWPATPRRQVCRSHAGDHTIPP